MILNFGHQLGAAVRVRSSAVGSAALASGAGSRDRTEVGPEERGYANSPAIAPKRPIAARKTTMPMTRTTIKRKTRNQKQPL
jgi:hypothetical protein